MTSALPTATLTTLPTRILAPAAGTHAPTFTTHTTTSSSAHQRTSSTHNGALPLDAEVIREALARELESAKEENRHFYIDSSRKMIQMQERIDQLTRENVKLIQSLAPAQTLNW